MSNKQWNYTDVYSNLYSKWKRERSSDVIQPLEYNFYTQIWDILNSIIQNSHEDVIERTIISRVSFLFENLKNLRWTKLNNYIIRDLNLETSLLTSQETEAIKILKGLNDWYRKLPNQIEQIPFLTSTALKSNLDSGKEKSRIISTNQFNEKVEVKFLKQLAQFLGPDLNSYGPFEKDTISILPKKLVQDILLPKNVVRIIE
ncbi:MAG: hypothetical protein HeimC3_43100 [Candidatus Heimdallarchaeota archaeon LC_3]|nr:MAG: hypothetical protein HeimC3_43100 [Candidatus Heimdallarchaeota archaeon LC_3]